MQGDFVTSDRRLDGEAQTNLSHFLRSVSGSIGSSHRRGSFVVLLSCWATARSASRGRCQGVENLQDHRELGQGNRAVTPRRRAGHLPATVGRWTDTAVTYDTGTTALDFPSPHGNSGHTKSSPSLPKNVTERRALPTRATHLGGGSGETRWDNHRIGESPS